jgi:SAM-dependent methyltransferase
VGQLAHSPEDLDQIYRNRFTGRLAYRQRVWVVLVKFFARWIPADAAVLDLGCGYCEFINNVRAGRKFAMDLNPEASNRAAAGTTVFQQDCSEAWPVPANSLDVVFTSNFFEHLPTKAHLERTLIEAYRALKPGGCLIALGPNLRYLTGRYWDYWDHYVPLTEMSLGEVLRKLGYEIAVSMDRFLPFTMSEGGEYPIWTLQAYLQLPIAWKVFGKQFLVVAKRPELPC